MFKLINENYGSRKGFVLSMRYQAESYLGKFNKYQSIPWGSVGRLIFICKGNICRSAFAAEVAKSLGLDAMSAGIHAIFDASADEQAISTAQKLGYDLSSHRTTPIVYPILRDRDLLVAMEPWQAKIVSRYLSKPMTTTLLGLWGKPQHPYIHDPYGSSSGYFDHCFKYIEISVHAIADKIKKAN